MVWYIKPLRYLVAKRISWGMLLTAEIVLHEINVNGAFVGAWVFAALLLFMHWARFAVESECPSCVHGFDYDECPACRS